MEDPDLLKLKEKIYEILGFNADCYEIKHFKRRIQTRMWSTKSQDYKKYLEYLKNNNEEKEKLKAALTVNVTEFFRNSEVFGVFHERVMPELIKIKTMKPGLPLRIWSLGCATGEEPYSIAMLVADSLGDRLKNFKVTIYATDIDKDALSTARKGEYGDVSKTPKDYVKKYMVKESNGRFTFKKEITGMITFLRHNIFSDKLLRNIDVLFCRNTIIYFNTESKKDLYRLFNNSLVMGGYLILGKAESFINQRDYGFEALEKRCHIFKKVKGEKQKTV